MNFSAYYPPQQLLDNRINEILLFVILKKKNLEFNSVELDQRIEFVSRPTFGGGFAKYILQIFSTKRHIYIVKNPQLYM